MSKQDNPVMVPLFQQMLNDPNVRIQTRGIDCDWIYKKFIDESVSGFNPFENTIYLSQNSAASKWVKAKYKNFRKHNLMDRLMIEYLFMMHDYLHIWGYQWISRLAPQIGFGKNAVNGKNFEDFVFCHLLTEAIAVVGLDYWFLSTVDFCNMTNVGSNTGLLTVSYHVKNDDEFRRFNPKFNTQHVDFFKFIAEFYCTGVFYGFDRNTLIQSPITLSWLNHEISYSSLQRVYSRQWINTLQNQGRTFTKRELEQPVDCSKKWKKELISEIGKLLWDKIKNDVPHYSGKKVRYPYLKNPKHPYSEMMNLNKIRLEGSENFNMHFNQLISKYRFSDFDHQEVEIIRILKDKKDIKLIESFLKMKKPLPVSKNEPTFLFMLP